MIIFLLEINDDTDKYHKKLSVFNIVTPNHILYKQKEKTMMNAVIF